MLSRKPGGGECRGMTVVSKTVIWLARLNPSALTYSNPVEADDCKSSGSVDDVSELLLLDGVFFPPLCHLREICQTAAATVVLL